MSHSFACAIFSTAIHPGSHSSREPTTVRMFNVFPYRVGTNSTNAHARGVNWKISNMPESIASNICSRVKKSNPFTKRSINSSAVFGVVSVSRSAVGTNRPTVSTGFPLAAAGAFFAGVRTFAVAMFAHSYQFVSHHSGECLEC